MTNRRDWKLVQSHNPLFPLQHSQGGRGHDPWPMCGAQQDRDVHCPAAPRLEGWQRWTHRGPPLCGFLGLASQSEASECGPPQVRRGSKQWNKLMQNCLRGLSSGVSETHGSRYLPSDIPKLQGEPGSGDGSW